MNRPDTPKVVQLHRAKPRLIRPAPDRLKREVADMDAWPNRPKRKPEPIPTKLSDFALGAAWGFLVGISPFLAMLAVMVFAS